MWEPIGPNAVDKVIRFIISIVVFPNSSATISFIRPQLLYRLLLMVSQVSHYAAVIFKGHFVSMNLLFFTQEIGEFFSQFCRF